MRNETIGVDSVGLTGFAKVVERFCRYSYITILLYRNIDGLSLAEISSALSQPLDSIADTLDILVRDETVEEDRNRGIYMLSDFGSRIYDLYDSDATITLESRLNTIDRMLDLYKVASENNDDEARLKKGREITNYLYRTYTNTEKELHNLRSMVEKEYKTQRNLRTKAQMLDIYIKNLEDILFSLDVQRRETKADGKRTIYRNLKQMLNEDQYYGVDYKSDVGSFFKNFNSRLFDSILALYNLFREWWGKTKTAMEDHRIASEALEVIRNYNPANTALKELVESKVAPLPPVFRRFAKADLSTDDLSQTIIDTVPRILRLDEVNPDDWDIISSCCASLHFDFVSFEPIKDQAVPQGLLNNEPEVFPLYVIDKEQEIRVFKNYDGTLLEFLKSRYPDLDDNNLLQVFLEIALETGERPMVFDNRYDAVFQNEAFNDKYDVISIRNRRYERTEIPADV